MNNALFTILIKSVFVLVARALCIQSTSVVCVRAAAIAPTSPAYNIA
jgi:hypothetical protein